MAQKICNDNNKNIIKSLNGLSSIGLTIVNIAKNNISESFILFLFAVMADMQILHTGFVYIHSGKHFH